MEAFFRHRCAKLDQLLRGSAGERFDKNEVKRGVDKAGSSVLSFDHLLSGGRGKRELRKREDPAKAGSTVGES